MRRNAEASLTAWFKDKTRKPLILRGARQVGKSTLVRNWSASQGLDVLEVNLELYKLKSPKKETVSIPEILDEIQLRQNQRITPRTILFLDEIQEQPELIRILRYFYESRPDLAVIAAGSLLEMVLKSEEISFPVGRVEFLHLGPMSFGEFLEATGQELLLESLRSGRSGPVEHELAKTSFRNYLYVGGMPKAVSVFANEKSLVPVRMIQEQLIQAYLSDFPKYNSRIASSRIQEIFRASVINIGKKVIYQRFSSGAQSRDIKRVIELLIDARILLPSFHSEGSGVPLGAQIDRSVFKLYFLDVGLMNAMLRVDLETLDQELKNHFISKGAMAEQFVAQHLNGIRGDRFETELNYWLKDKGSQKGEIDFLIEDAREVIPVEVKATGVGHLKSLFYFAKEKHIRRAIRLSLLPAGREPGRHKIGETTVQIELENIPIYCAEWIRSLRMP
jgi:hypothetical protein